MGMTMAEKILARKSGRDSVSVGDIVVCKVDWAVTGDLGFDPTRPELVRVWDPNRILIVADHVAPAPTIAAADDMVRIRRFANKFGIPNVYDIGRQGISHVVIGEQGFALPGSLIANADSHSCAAGAFNCASRGLGGPEMTYVLCTGETWFIVYPTVRFVLKGKLPDRVTARDVLHYIAGEYGDFSNHNVEYVGPLVEGMSIASRQTLATMSAELSAEFALFEADQKLLDYLKDRAKGPIEPATADDNANFEAVYEIDVSNLDPQVALPGRVPKNVQSVRQVKDIKIDQAFVGSCANGRLEDFAIVAEIVKGKKVAPDVRFIITPGSQEVYKEALKAGYVDTLLEAEAMVTNSTCGACPGGHMGVLGGGEVCITASTRNFQGRMGSQTAQIYLGSPATVAASALVGHIADPRDV